MNDDIPTISNTPSIEETIAGGEARKTVSEIAANVVNQYGANGGESEKKPRKPRSDKGVARGARKGLENNSAQSQNGVATPCGETIGFSIDKAIVEKTVKVTIGTVDGLFVRKIGRTTMALGGDINLAKELAESAALTTAELDLMGNLSGIIAEKHGLLTGYAPEILLAMLVGEWGFRVTLVMRRLNAMAVELKKKEKNVSSSPPDKDHNNRQIG